MYITFISVFFYQANYIFIIHIKFLTYNFLNAHKYPKFKPRIITFKKSEDNSWKCQKVLRENLSQKFQITSAAICQIIALPILDLWKSTAPTDSQRKINLTYLSCFLMSSSEPTKSLKVLSSARGARSRLVRLTCGRYLQLMRTREYL